MQEQKVLVIGEKTGVTQSVGVNLFLLVPYAFMFSSNL